MTHLAIKGHPTRGSEVIALLEMLGYINKHNYSADCDSLCFYGDKSTNIVYYDWVNNCYEDEDILVFTLEEFLEKFPYKVGDKVLYKIYNVYSSIKTMTWNEEKEQVIYRLDSQKLWVATADELQPKEKTLKVTEEFYNKYCISCGSQRCTRSGEWLEECEHYKAYNKLQSYKEKTMDRKNTDNWAKWDLPDGYEFQDKDGNIINTSVIRLVKKQIQYPKTLEECCKIINTLPHTRNGVSGYASGKLWALQKLLICRDAYWKIAGDWKPDFTNFDEERFGIYTQGDKIVLESYGGGDVNVTLTFPTAEMRDSFYESFKDLIEQCKELL